MGRNNIFLDEYRACEKENNLQYESTGDRGWCLVVKTHCHRATFPEQHPLGPAHLQPDVLFQHLALSVSQLTVPHAHLPFLARPRTRPGGKESHTSGAPMPSTRVPCCSFTTGWLEAFNWTSRAYLDQCWPGHWVGKLNTCEWTSGPRSNQPGYRRSVIRQDKVLGIICTTQPLFSIEETEAQRDKVICPKYLGLKLIHLPSFMDWTYISGPAHIRDAKTAP